VGRLLPREENLFLHDLPANASSRKAAAEFQKIITTAKNVAGADADVAGVARSPPTRISSR
jgi:hypothetical protein